MTTTDDVRTFPGAGTTLSVSIRPAREPSALPPVLLLHGIWEDRHSLDALGEQLAARRPVLAADLRGHGESGRPPSGYRFADHAADVAALLDALATDHGCVDVLGHSLGAVVALWVAAQGHPALGRVVSVDPPLLRAADWPAVRADMARARELSRRTADEVAAELGRGSTRDPAWLHMIATALVGTADGVFAAMTTGGEQGEVDWTALLAGVTADVLAVAPDPDVPGGLLTGERLALLREALPAARVCVVAGAGHHVEVDRPAELLDAVTAFLDERRA